MATDSTHIRISRTTRARLQAQRELLQRAYDRGNLRADLDWTDHGLSDDALVGYLLDQAEAHQARARAAQRQRRKGRAKTLSEEEGGILADMVNTTD